MNDKKRKKILSESVELDGYLLSISRAHESHAFLGRATQGCYVRQVDLLVKYFEDMGRARDSVKVLDWGSGKGHISYLLSKAGFDVTSCDIGSDADDSAFGQSTPIVKEQGLDVVRLEHPWKLPFKDNVFDLVVSFGVLEHVPADRKSLGEIRRVLVPGGTFFFSFLPYWLSWTQRLAHARGNYYHDRLYRKSQIESMAAENGFVVASVWHGQLLPKNTFGHSNALESIDRFFTNWTPLKYFATNLEGLMVAK